MTVMKVAQVVESNKPLITTTLEVPTPGPRDVLVKVEACCLVPNSVNVINMQPNDRFTLPEKPFVSGLDAAGVVAAVGNNVFGLKVGDRVYVDPWLTCGTCPFCRQG